MTSENGHHRFERTLPFGALAGAISMRQTITPLAYAHTAVSGVQSTAAEAPAPHPPLPRITLGERATSATGPAGNDLQLLDVLGEGGMGVVSLAVQRSLRREVAVKTLRSGDVDPRCARALLQEAVTTGSLEHPSIVPVHALGTDESGRPVMVMKRVEGTCWRDLIEDPHHAAWSHLAPDENYRLEFHLETVEQVCNALHFAHRRGIVHRDVKPENVMIGSFGEIYLLDWGIATRPWTRGEQPSSAPDLVGTPVYMAPEMVTLEECTERTDVYLLGATLHEFLTGRPRHDASSIQSVLARALESKPHDYDVAVAEELAALCNRATARDSTMRPASALEFRDALRDFRRHRSSIAAARAALNRFAELEPLLSTTADEEPRRIRLHKLFAECRFGLMHALHEWPENTAARHGLVDVLSAMIEHELGCGHVDAADSLLAEMDAIAAPPAPLRERLAAARHEQERARAEASRLRTLVREHDTRVGGRARGLVISVIGLFGATAWGDRGTMLGLTILYFGALALLMYALRQRILVNHAGRVLAGLFASTVALIIVHRAAALVTSEPTPSILGNDLMILACSLVAAGIAVQCAYLWFGILVVMISVCAALFPQHAVPLFCLGGLVVVPVGWLSWRTEPKALL